MNWRKTAELSLYMEDIRKDLRYDTFYIGFYNRYFLFLVLFIPVLIVEWIIGKFNRKAKDYSSHCAGAFKLILWITGVKVTVIGEENIPDEPVLFIGNHRSFFDILLTYSRCKRLTGYVAKKEMLKFPLLRDWMKIFTVCSLTVKCKGRLKNYSHCH